MRLSFMIRGFAFLAAAACFFSAGTNISADEGEVQRLLRERMAVLEKIVEFRRAAYDVGVGELKALLDAQRDVAAAKVELAATRDERMAALRELVKVSKAAEERAKIQFEAGRSTQLDSLVAASFRLKAESELAREESKAP